MFGVRNILNMVSVLFRPGKNAFGNILAQKYRTYVPVCACAECPLGLRRTDLSFDTVSLAVKAEDEVFCYIYS